MAHSEGKLLEVKCPCCEALLQIDTETQLVINHRAPERRPLIEDLKSAVEGLKGEAAKRNDIFEKSFASHLSSGASRDKKFDELLKTAKQDTTAPPKRPFDLD